MDEIDTVAVGSVPSLRDGERVVCWDSPVWVAEPAELVLQVTASDSAGSLTTERFEARSEGDALAAAELRGPHGTRSHVLHAPPWASPRFLPVRGRHGAPRPAGDAGRPRRARAVGGPLEARLPATEPLLPLRPSGGLRGGRIRGGVVGRGRGAGHHRLDPPSDRLRGRLELGARLGRTHPAHRHGDLPRLRPPGRGPVPGGGHPGPVRIGLRPGPVRPWTSTPCSRSWRTGVGSPATPPTWPPVRPWCASPPGATRPHAAFASVVAGIATLESLEVTATVDDVLPTDDRAGRFQLA